MTCMEQFVSARVSGRRSMPVKTLVLPCWSLPLMPLTHPQSKERTSSLACGVASLATFAALSISSVSFPVVGIAETLHGPARVVDGDTLVLNGKTRVRLFGMDAPETKQLCKNQRGAEYACGEESKLALAKLVGTRDVTCQVKNEDRYNREVAICFSGSGANLNEEMVRQGWAVAYRQYSKAYETAEQSAKKEKLGIWSGSFEEPARFRAERRRESSTHH